LAVDPSGTTVALVRGFASGGSPAIESFNADGQDAGDYGFVCESGSNMLPPRAVAFGSDSNGNDTGIAIVGQVRSPDGGASNWSGCLVAGPGSAGATVDCTGSNCGEAIDVAAGNGTFYVAAENTTGGFTGWYADGGGWTPGSARSYLSKQLAWADGGEPISLNWNGQNASIGPIITNPAAGFFSHGAEFESLDLPAGGPAYLGGQTDAGASVAGTTVSLSSTLSTTSLAVAPGAGIVDISARGGYVAYLYYDATHGLRVARQRADGSGLEIAPASYAAMTVDGALTGVTHTGRRIAVMATGAVFFVANDDGWYWPAP